MLVSTLLAIAPHLAVFLRYGSWEYVSDKDDSIYLAVTRIPYHGENTLRDPFSGKWEGLPSEYTWIPYVPTGMFNRTLGLPLLASTLEWRIAGGLLFGAALFLLFRVLFAATRHPSGWALGCSLICLGDAGFIQGRSFVQDFTLLPHLMAGTTPLTKPDAIPQYRVCSPLLMLPFLLLLATAFLPAGHNSRKWVAAGVIGLGMCFNMYFYYWTGAVAGILLYVAMLWLESWRKRKSERSTIERPWAATRFAALVLAGGLLVGAPQLGAMYNIASRPQYKPLLERLCLGQHVPASDPYRRMNLRNTWAIGKLAITGVAILVFDLSGLGILWCLSFAGFVLANGAMVTGLEFENWHWQYLHAPMSEILLLGVAAMLLDRIPGRSFKPLWALPVILVSIAAVWRPYEALTAPEAVYNNRMLAELRPFRQSLESLGAGHLLAGPIPEADLALIFSKSGRLFHFYSGRWSLISDEEVHVRQALNAWLEGDDLATFSAPTAQGEFSPCAITVPEWRPEEVQKRRKALYLGFRDNAVDPALLTRYRPDYLLARTAVVPDARIGQWVLLKGTDKWNLWTRQAR